MLTLKRKVQQYWNDNPCTKSSLKSTEKTKDFFLEHDRLLEKLYPYADEVLKYEDCCSKRVLEIGCGMANHALKMSKFTRRMIAGDLSYKSLEIAKKRLNEFNAKVDVINLDSENLCFHDEVFDRIYCLGVIHHTPQTEKAIEEIYRVLKHSGEVILMLYHKNSIFYYFTILFRNRIKFVFLKILPQSIINIFRELSPEILRLKEVIDRIEWHDLKQFTINTSTDTLGNPLSKVYTKKDAQRLFNKFSRINFDVRGSSNRLEGRFRFLESKWGWFLYIYSVK